MVHSGYESLDVAYKRVSDSIPLPSFDGRESGPHETVAMQHVAEKLAQWTHIDNLDDFFTRIYEYHQRHGFLCMLLSDLFELFQFVFVVSFTVFLAECVDYPILFKDKLPANHTASDHYKVALSDAVQCSKSFSFSVVICIITASVFWLHRLIQAIYRSFQYWEMRNFFICELRINSDDLENMTWHEVQQRLCLVQKEQQLCIHKDELTELDIYQRILRYKNYLVAMVNKKILPAFLHVPLVGDCAYLTNGFKVNLELILFWGPWTPWQSYGQLRPGYKRRDKREEMVRELRKVVLWFGIANLVLAPLVLIWQVLYAFFSYAELIKREPSFLGGRRWSIYGRYFFRHLNELDHELDMRLSRGYRPASQYMDLFFSNIMDIVAKNVAFFVGALLAVLLALTAYDEDVLQAEHVLTAITMFGIVIIVCRTFIANENVVWCPELLMNHVLAHVHYIPDNWRGLAHTERVRREFAQLFQYKAVFVLEELLSPIITPLVLLFWLRPRSGEFVDFIRNFSIEVPGLGDVCSFAQLDVKRHGNPLWQVNHESFAECTAEYGPTYVAQEQDHLGSLPPFTEEANVETPLTARAAAAHLDSQTNLGKTELSLLHFTVTNPNWVPPEPSSRFMTGLREYVAFDAEQLQHHQEQLQSIADNPLWQSLSLLTTAPLSMAGYGASSLSSSANAFGGADLPPLGVPVSAAENMYQPSFSAAGAPLRTIRGPGLSRFEGPVSSNFSPQIGAGYNNLLNNQVIGGGLGLTGLMSSSGGGGSGAVVGLSSDLNLSTTNRVATAGYTSFNAATASKLSDSLRTAAGMGVLEGPATELSLSVLYMHKLHQRKLKDASYGSIRPLSGLVQPRPFLSTLQHAELPRRPSKDITENANYHPLWQVPGPSANHDDILPEVETALQEFHVNP